MCPTILIISTTLCINYQWPSAGVTLALAPVTIVIFVNTMLSEYYKAKAIKVI